MGQKIGHAPAAKAGRPKGAKNNALRKTTKEAADEIRHQLTMVYRENEPELLAKLIRELKSLEGYAYVSALSAVLKNIMPALQSIELNANLSQTKSLVIEHIEELKLQKK